MKSPVAVPLQYVVKEVIPQKIFAHRHEVGVHGMDKSLMSSLPAWPMITSEVLIWLNRIRRRMSANPKASNPWTIEVKRDLPQEIFEVLVKSVQGAPSAFGVSVEDNVIKYTKKIVSCAISRRFVASLRVKSPINLRKALAGTVKVLKQRCLRAGKSLISISYNCKRNTKAANSSLQLWMLE